MNSYAVRLAPPGFVATIVVSSLVLMLGPASEAHAQTPCATTDVAVTGVTPAPSEPAALAADCAALLGLMDTLRGTASLNWANSLSMTSWDGITVTGSRVTDLSLHFYQLTGSIPDDLSSLTGLQFLWLHNNQLTGGIPDLSSLTDLRELFLNDNPLSGEIPDVSSLTRLQSLNLSRNQLTGGIPDLSSLTDLRELSLGGNALSGEIPDLSSLTRLQLLLLFENELSGSIPPALSDLTDLIDVRLYQNQLSGEIPDLGALTKLIRIYLSENQLSGPMPDLSGLPELRNAQFQQNQLSGSIPELSDLPKLQLLYLHQNQLSGSIPDLSDLTTLINLLLFDNKLSGSMDASHFPTSLSILYLHQNQLSGSIPDLSALTRLTRLVLSDNELSGSIPDLSALTRLTWLLLPGNQLSGSIPDLSALSQLQYLYLHRNRLSGAIPTTLGTLGSLTRLFLAGNPLEGGIPSQLGSLTSLQHLALCGTELDATATLPSALETRRTEGDLTVWSCLRIEDASADEGSELIFEVEHSTYPVRGVVGATDDLTLSYETEDGTASSADYTGTEDGSVTIPANTDTDDSTSSATIIVPTTADTVDDDDETLTVTVKPADPAGWGTTLLALRRTATGTILGTTGTDPPESDLPTSSTPAGPGGGLPVRRKPQPLQLALWTDRPAYRLGETVRLYRTLDPHDDKDSYRTFAYLERAEGGERRYLAPLTAAGELHPEPVDAHRIPLDVAPARILTAADRALCWEGEAFEPGLWHFVMELRPGSSEREFNETEQPYGTRRAWAKFTVAEHSHLLNRRGFDREVRADLTLRADTIYYLLHQLFVHAGATLTIEPGTVVLASGRHAAIIVEPGGRIVADATRQAPAVLSCSAPVGQREPGCWGGLRILGRAPVTRLLGVAPGVLPTVRAIYGASEDEGSSGVLRHVRVEFAGAAADPETAVPAIGLYGVGSDTVLDHVQVRSSHGTGIAFAGGTARCEHCVISGSGEAGVAWERGWRGGASHLFVQHGSRGFDGLAGSNDDEGHDLQPRSLPMLSNVTLVHARPYGRRARQAVAVRLASGSGVTARDLLANGFLAGVIRAGMRAVQLFHDGESSIASSLFYPYSNGFWERRQLRGGLDTGVEFLGFRDPKLRDVRWFANPDPRPKPSSPALEDGEEGHEEGEISDEGMQMRYIGAFGEDENWLEEWTVFGAESDYDPTQREGSS